MPKLGMEPIRREALVKATIAEVGFGGTLDVTVARIARRAGMLSALAHHYFGGKEQMFLAAMRHVLRVYAAAVRGALAGAPTGRARAEALIRANFAAGSFRREVVSAWLNFYVYALTVPEARRLVRVYHARLRSNLVDALRPLVGGRAPALAGDLAALIDGVYLHAVLGTDDPDGPAAAARVLAHLDAELQRAGS